MTTVCQCCLSFAPSESRVHATRTLVSDSYSAYGSFGALGASYGILGMRSVFVAVSTVPSRWYCMWYIT